MSRSTLFTALALAALTLAGCGKHPTRAQPTSLLGKVSSSTGQDVPGARVQISYSLVLATSAASLAGRGPGIDDVPVGPGGAQFTRRFILRNNPCTAGRVTVDFELPNAGRIQCRIRDRQGTLRRTLADRLFPAGVFSITWDGRDDQNAPLPAEVYVVDWVDTEGDSTFHFSANLLWQAPLPESGPNVVCTSAGDFVYPLDALPIGIPIDAVDEQGNPQGLFVIGSRVQLCAAGEVAGVTQTGCADVVDVGDRKASVNVRITLP